MYTLDKKSCKKQTQRSRIMTFKREQGLPSDRPKPTDKLPDWLIK